jgi:hypothetical protein
MGWEGGRLPATEWRMGGDRFPTRYIILYRVFVATRGEKDQHEARHVLGAALLRVSEERYVLDIPSV